MNKRILCVLLCFTLVFTALVFSAPSNTASAATKTELEDKLLEDYEELEELEAWAAALEGTTT